MVALLINYEKESIGSLFSMLRIGNAVMTFFDLITSQQTSREISTHCSTLFGILVILTLVKGLLLLLSFSPRSSGST